MKRRLDPNKIDESNVLFWEKEVIVYLGYWSI